MRKKIVAGNWKMNGSHQQIIELVTALTQKLENTSTDIVLFPPSLYIPLVSNLILNTHSLSIGAQNVYPKDHGAYTGEISAPQLLDYHCRYVLVGHSERRQLFQEDENFITQKFHHVKEHDMIPILCVGETLFERENNLTEQVIAKQVLAVTGKHADVFSKCVIAYEPVWAIGTGITATVQQVQAVHEYIRGLVATINPTDAAALPLLYGGSVNEKNAQAIFSMPDVDGGLVGGASLNAVQFAEIVKCIN
jgi:triosephosphate isomerase